MCDGGEETRKIKKIFILWGVHEVALKYVLAHAVYFSFSFARSESILMRKYLQHKNHGNIYRVFYTDVIEGYIGVYSKLNNVKPMDSLWDLRQRIFWIHFHPTIIHFFLSYSSFFCVCVSVCFVLQRVSVKFKLIQSATQKQNREKEKYEKSKRNEKVKHFTQ